MKALSQQIITEKQVGFAIEKMVEDMIFYNRKKPHFFKELLLIGLVSKGDIIAKRIKQLVLDKVNVDVPVYTLDISFFRDDLHLRDDTVNVIYEQGIPNLEHKHVILVDDVIFEGRTLRSGLAALVEYGRAEKIECAALVDRGHRKMPIAANYVGIHIETRHQDYIHTRLIEVDGVEEIILETLD